MALLCEANSAMLKAKGENKAKSVVMKHPRRSLCPFYGKTWAYIG